MTSHAPEGDEWSVEDTYFPDQNRSLSEAVLDAIATYKDADIIKSEFTLFESIDPDALNRLFRRGAMPNTRVEFTVDDVRVRCWGDHGVEIRVAGRPDAPEKTADEGGR